MLYDDTLAYIYMEKYCCLNYNIIICINDEQHFQYINFIISPG